MRSVYFRNIFMKPDMKINRINDYFSFYEILALKSGVFLESKECDASIYEGNDSLFLHAMQLALPEIHIYGDSDFDSVVWKNMQHIVFYNYKPSEFNIIDKFSTILDEAKCEYIKQWFDLIVDISKKSKIDKFLIHTNWFKAYDNYIEACEGSVENAIATLMACLNGLLVVSRNRSKATLCHYIATLISSTKNEYDSNLEFYKAMYEIRSKDDHGNMIELIPLLDQRIDIAEDWKKIKIAASELLFKYCSHDHSQIDSIVTTKAAALGITSY